MALFTTSKPKIFVKSLARFPARVAAENGVGLTQENGNYTFGLDYASLDTNISMPDPSDWTVLVYNSQTGVYEQLPLDSLPSNGGGGGGTDLGVHTHADTVADFEATEFGPEVHAATILGYSTIGVGGFNVRRTYSEPTHNWKFRSVDRYLPNETYDAINGGWWEGYSEDGLYHLASFGGKSDGYFDNAPIFYIMNSVGQVVCANGETFHVYCEPTHSAGTWNFDHSQCQGFLFNLPKFHLDGKGTTFHNVYSGPDNFGYNLPWGVAAMPLVDGAGGVYSWKINSAASGDTQITLTTPADANNLTVGQYVLVECMDAQFYGYPPNPERYDFVKVLTKNATTGVVTFEPPLSYDYSSSLPDAGASPPAGAARVWLLSTANWTFQTAPTGSVTWDIDHTYEDLTVLLNNPALTYTTLTGRKIRTIGWKGAGFSESISYDVSHADAELSYAGEPDKLVKSIHHKNSVVADVNGTYYRPGGYSIDLVTYDSCEFRTGLGGGRVKNLIATNCDIQSLSSNWSQNAVFQNCRVYSMPYWNNNWYDGIGSDYDGVNVTFADGVFKILKSANIAGYWAATPGDQIYLVLNGRFSTNEFAGNDGAGYVLKTWEDATYLYLETSLPHATFPAWARSNVVVQKSGPLSFFDCGGCREVESASYATRKGYNSWECFHFMMAGKEYWPTKTNDGYGNYWPSVMTGAPLSVKLNVIKPAATGGGLFAIIFNYYDAATKAFVNDMQMAVNTEITGLRTYTTAGTIGIQTGDEFKEYYGTPTTYTQIPSDILIEHNTSYRFANDLSAFTENEMPVIEIEMIFDTGIFRNLLKL